MGLLHPWLHPPPSCQALVSGCAFLCVSAPAHRGQTHDCVVAQSEASCFTEGLWNLLLVICHGHKRLHHDWYSSFRDVALLRLQWSILNLGWLLEFPPSTTSLTAGPRSARCPGRRHSLLQLWPQAVWLCCAAPLPTCLPGVPACSCAGAALHHWEQRTLQDGAVLQGPWSILLPPHSAVSSSEVYRVLGRGWLCTHF